ncbi:MAG TPA: hypothetical protein PKX46_04930 [Clostridia bacterium]|nr:hypothetical protein [Clostridia bacterium]
MNYLQQINAFERWLETSYLPYPSQLLWYKLMCLGNRSGWSEWVIVDNRRLMSMMQQKHEKTLIRWRDALIDAGLVEYKRGSKGAPGRYKLLSFTVKNEAQMTAYTPAQMTAYTPAQMTAQTTAIYKHKQNKTKENVSHDTSKKTFVIPDLTEVEAYCKERGNFLDAQKFIDFYTSKGWMIGKNRMKDWKAAVRTWEAKDGDTQRMAGSSTKKLDFSK